MRETVIHSVPSVNLGEIVEKVLDKGIVIAEILRYKLLILTC